MLSWVEHEKSFITRGPDQTAEAQVDLGFLRPHILEDTFLHGNAQFGILSLIKNCKQIKTWWSIKMLWWKIYSYDLDQTHKHMLWILIGGVLNKYPEHMFSKCKKELEMCPQYKDAPAVGYLTIKLQNSTWYKCLNL